MASKRQFLDRSLDVIIQLALLQEQITGLAGVYTSRGYQANGVDPIVDADLADVGSGLTAAQFSTMVVALLSDYLAFCNNTAVPTKDRKSDMNRARKDF